MAMLSDEFYERYWREYGSESCGDDPTIGERLARLKTIVRQLGPGSVIGDVGCGSGLFTAALDSWGFDAYGCDVAAEAIQLARKAYPKGKFEVNAVGGRLPWPDQFCDAIWCTEVLEHVFDVYGFMAEVSRALKPNGLFVITTPYLGVIKNVMIALFRFSAHYNPWLSHIRFFDKRSLSDCLKRGGFHVNEWLGIGRFWPLYKSFFVIARKVIQPSGRPKIIG